MYIIIKETELFRERLEPAWEHSDSDDQWLFAETVSEYFGTEYDLLYVYEDGTYREVRGLRKIPDGLPCPVRNDLDYDSVKRTLKKRRGVFRGK